MGVHHVTLEFSSDTKNDKEVWHKEVTSEELEETLTFVATLFQEKDPIIRVDGMLVSCKNN